MELDYYRMKTKNQSRINRMYKRRAAGLMTREQFFAVVNWMIRQEEAAAALDRFGIGFLADLATDRLRASGLTEADDLWPWIEDIFRISWCEWVNNARIKNAAGLACIRVFYGNRRP